MNDQLYQRLQDLAERVAMSLERPRFYRTFSGIIARTDALVRDDSLTRRCRSELNESLLECAHGLCHCEAVARDAGAIVMIEGRERGMDDGALMPLVNAAIIAGMLHDIKRREPDHAVRGSIEAERILAGMGMETRYREYVAYAIRNHEAFKTTCDLDDADGCLVSDALYDADKFRWGPENFTTTLWLIVRSRGTAARDLYGMFPEKMRGIENIKQTFRTGTGRAFGPEIIDQGLLIGNSIYQELTAMLSGSA